MSVGFIIALVVMLVALLGALGLITVPVGLVLWLIAFLALAVLLSGAIVPWPPYKRSD